MKALKGDELFEMPGDSGSGMTSEDQEVYMMPERMAAWAHIMLADDLPLPMLITSHPTVLEDLVEQTIQGFAGITVFTDPKSAGRRCRMCFPVSR